MARSISKKLRFSIFHRDRFTCAYCGRTPPGVVLEVDHVVPVAEGGGDDAENLITACFDCNRGKSDTDLAAVPQSLMDSIEVKREALEQVRAYNKFLLKVREEELDAADRLDAHWCASLDFETQGLPAAERFSSLRTFLRHLTEAEILDAMDVAIGWRGSSYPPRRWRYFCGVCWKKINGESR